MGGSGCFPGGGNGNPLQYAFLEIPMDRGAWRAADHRVAQSRTRLSVRAATVGVFAMSEITVPSCSVSAVLEHLLRHYVFFLRGRYT